MSASTLRYAFILSLLVNLGVIAAVGYQVLRHDGLPALSSGAAAEIDLPEYLKLSATQRERWHALEEHFLRGLDTGWRELAAHRERLIREIFSAQPDPARIESERTAIAQMQMEQQQHVLRQLLAERDMLDTQQRQALADLLLREAPAAPFERRLHQR